MSAPEYVEGFVLLGSDGRRVSTEIDDLDAAIGRAERRTALRGPTALERRLYEQHRVRVQVTELRNPDAGELVWAPGENADTRPPLAALPGTESEN